ncbi:MAG: ATP-binding protein, partial [Candidatus Cloacimonadaceae bacterium]
ELYTKTENEIRILFKVEDSGIGIQQQRLKDIFENYTQAEDAIGLKYGGTGLGLAIVKRLVELMQGFIWVESEPGKGSCFYFIIPFAIKVPGKEPDAFIQAPKIPKRSLLRGRVLLGDNNKMLHLFASKLLQMWGLKIDIAKDGEEVIRMHKEKLYDLILVSSQLRVIDAVGICHEIRHIERVLQRKTPIIAGVESETEEEIMYLKANGIDECIKKPMNLDLLYEMLSKYLPKADE